MSELASDLAAALPLRSCLAAAPGYHLPWEGPAADSKQDLPSCEINPEDRVLEPPMAALASGIELATFSSSCPHSRHGTPDTRLSYGAVGDCAEQGLLSSDARCPSPSLGHKISRARLIPLDPLPPLGDEEEEEPVAPTDSGPDTGHSQLHLGRKASSLWPRLTLELEAQRLTCSSIAAEIRTIYSTLVPLRQRCASIINPSLSSCEHVVALDGGGEARHCWQALIALHRTLLHEHHDFFLASQHPSRIPALRQLAAKYSMPARMWRHGIHSFLELLRHRLPDSAEHMLVFIYLAYQMIALLFKMVDTVTETWIECLGDLARYRMAIEEEDLRYQGEWTRVSRMWYRKAVDRNPGTGRLQHHLAILTRPKDALSLSRRQPPTSTRARFFSARSPISFSDASNACHAVRELLLGHMSASVACMARLIACINSAVLLGAVFATCTPAVGATGDAPLTEVFQHSRETPTSSRGGPDPFPLFGTVSLTATLFVYLVATHRFADKIWLWTRNLAWACGLLELVVGNDPNGHFDYRLRWPVFELAFVTAMAFVLDTSRRVRRTEWFWALAALIALPPMAIIVALQQSAADGFASMLPLSACIGATLAARALQLLSHPPTPEPEAGEYHASRGVQQE